MIPLPGKRIEDGMPLTDIFWQQIDECSGFEISDKDCHLRTDEMELIHYQPYGCKVNDLENCEELVAYARFNVSPDS